MGILKKHVCLLLVLIFATTLLTAQCPSASFKADTTCANDPVAIVNNSTGANYQWDFCSGDLRLNNYTRAVVCSCSVQSYSVKTAFDGTNWYAFTVGNNNPGNLFRISFGSSLANAPGTPDNLGNFGGVLNSSFGLDIIQEPGTGNWYILVVQASGLTRLDFGNSLANTPTSHAVTLPTGTLSGARKIDHVVQNGEIVVLVTQITARTVRLINFRGSMTRTVTTSDTLSSPVIGNSALGLWGITVIRDCNNWYCLLGGVSNGAIFRLNMGPVVFDSTPHAMPQDSLGKITGVFDIKVVRENGEYKCFAAAPTGANTLIGYLNFGSSIQNTPVFKNQTNSASKTYGLDLADDNSHWYMLNPEQALGTLQQVTFTENCIANPMTSTLANPTVTYVTPGTDTISLVVDSAVTTRDTIYIKPAPVVNFSFNNACEGKVVALADSSTTPQGTITGRNWNLGNGNSSSLSSLQVVYNNGGTYNVVLTDTNSIGCHASVSHTISIYNQPSAAFGYVSNCAGDTSFFTDSSTVVGGSITNWLWKWSGGITSTAQHPAIAFPVGGNLPDTLMVTSNQGCMDTLTGTIFIKPSPQLSTTVANACFGNITQFNNTSTIVAPESILSYNWDFGDNTSSTLTSPTKQYASPGNYTVTLSAVASNACTDTIYIPLFIGTPPVTNFTHTQACQGNAVQFTDLTRSVNPIIGWRWDFGDGTSDTSQNPVKIYTSSGTFSVTLCASVGLGCQNCITQQIIIQPGPSVQFTVDTVCLGNPNHFTYQASAPSPQHIISSTWDFGDGFGSTTASALTHQYIQPGSFPVTLTVVTDSGCSSVFAAPAIVNDNPVANFTVTAQCGSNVVNFTNASTISLGSIVSYAWDFGDGSPVDHSNNPAHTYATPGLYNTMLTVVSNHGCSDSILKVSGPDYVNFNMSADSVCLDSRVNLTPLSGSYSSFYWDLCSGDLKLDSVPSSTIQTLSGGTYDVKAIKDNGLWYVFALPQVGANGGLIKIVGQNTLAGGFGSQTNITGTLPSSYAFDFIKEGNNWYAFVVGNSSLTRIDFGNSLQNNIPTFQTVTIPSSPITQGRGITHAYEKAAHPGDPDTLILLITTNSASGSAVKMLRFRYGITANTIPANDVLVTPFIGSGNISLWSLDITKDCDNWVCMTTAFSTRDVYRINLGSTIFDNTMNIGAISPPIITTGNPAGIKIARENGDYKCFIADIVGAHTNVVYANFGSSILNPVVSTQSRGYNPSCFSLDLEEENSHWYLLNTASGNGTVVRTNFYEPCMAEPMTSFSDTTFGVKYLRPGNFHITLAGMLDGFQAKTVTKTIYVKPGPIADFGFISTCFGSPTIFLDSSIITDSLNGRINSWLWNFGDGDTTSVRNPVHIFNNVGNYQVSLIAAGSICSDTARQTVVITEKPHADFTTVANCERDSTYFTDASTFISDSIVQWNWDFGDSTIDTLKNPAHSFNISGNINVTLIVTNQKGCTDTVTHTIYIKPKPHFDVDVRNTCVGSTVNFLNNTTVVPPDNITSSFWTFGDGATSSVTSPGHAYASTVATYTATLFSTVSNGCNDSLKIEVHIATPPVPNFNALTLCQDNTAKLIDFSTGTSDTIMLWQWTFSNGDTAFGQIPSYEFPDSGTFLTTLTVVSPTYCAASISKNVHVLPAPKPDFIAPSICRGTPVNFSALVTAIPPDRADSVKWSFDGANISFTYNHQVTVFYRTPGDYTVELETWSDSGCYASIIKTISVNDTPVVSFSYPNVVCAGSYNTFSNTSTITPPSRIASYVWNFPDTTFYAPTVIYNFPSAGEDTIRLMVGSDRGCYSSLTRVFNVYAPLAADFSYENVCYGQTTTFKDLTPSFSIVIWDWDYRDTTYHGTTPVTQHQFQYPGQHQVKLTITNIIGCSSTVIKTLEIVPPPVADFNGLIGCENHDYAPVDNSSVQGDVLTHWDWTIGGIVYNNDRTPVHVFRDTGNYNVTLTVTSSKGCAASATKIIHISSNPLAQFTPNPLYGAAPVDINFINQSQFADSYLWNFGDNTFSIDANPSHTYSQNDSFNITLYAQNNSGCADSATRLLIIAPTDLDIAVDHVVATELPQSDGSVLIQVNANVTNVGTRLITFTKLYASIGTGQLIEEDLDTLMPAGSIPINYVFTGRFSLGAGTANTYVCVEAKDVNHGEPEIRYDNNRQCTSVDGAIQLIGPSPNPALDQASLGIVMPKAGKIIVDVFDAIGQYVLKDIELNLPVGRSDFIIPVSILQAGEYFIRVKYNDDALVRKFQVK